MNADKSGAMYFSRLLILPASHLSVWFSDIGMVEFLLTPDGSVIESTSNLICPVMCGAKG